MIFKLFVLLVLLVFAISARVLGRNDAESAPTAKAVSETDSAEPLCQEQCTDCCLGSYGPVLPDDVQAFIENKDQR